MDHKHLSKELGEEWGLRIYKGGVSANEKYTPVLLDKLCCIQN